MKTLFYPVLSYAKALAGDTLIGVNNFPHQR